MQEREGFLQPFIGHWVTQFKAMSARYTGGATLLLIKSDDDDNNNNNYKKKLIIILIIITIIMTATNSMGLQCANRP